MAEAVGLAFSAAGLLATCVDLYKQVQHGRNFAKEYTRRLTRFEMEQCRLGEWVQRVTQARNITESNLESVYGPIMELETLFTELKRILESYEIKDSPDSALGPRVSNPRSYGEFKHNSDSRVQRRDTQTSVGKRAKFTVVHSSKLDELLGHAKICIDRLESAERHWHAQARGSESRQWYRSGASEGKGLEDPKLSEPTDAPRNGLPGLPRTQPASAHLREENHSPDVPAWQSGLFESKTSAHLDKYIFPASPVAGDSSSSARPPEIAPDQTTLQRLNSLSIDPRSESRRTSANSSIFQGSSGYDAAGSQYNVATEYETLASEYNFGVQDSNAARYNVAGSYGNIAGSQYGAPGVGSWKPRLSSSSSAPPNFDHASRQAWPATLAEQRRQTLEPPASTDPFQTGSPGLPWTDLVPDVICAPPSVHETRVAFLALSGVYVFDTSPASANTSSLTALPIYQPREAAWTGVAIAGSYLAVWAPVDGGFLVSGRYVATPWDVA